MNMLQDLRYAVRALKSNPAFTAIAVATLALGIGANTAIFTAVHHLLFRPFPFLEDPDRLVAVWQVAPRGNDHNEVTAGDFRDWRENLESFDHLVMHVWWTGNVTGGERPERVQGMQVSADYFDAFGLRPALGRTFIAGEDQPGNDRLVVLSWGLWQRRFGGDSGVLGTVVEINGIPRTVIGVMPDGVRYPIAAEMWAPYAPAPATWESRRLHYLYVSGRLAPGVSLDEARAELTTLAATRAAQYPNTNTNWGANIQPLMRDTAREIESMLAVLMAAVGFVLLIACANVANLMLVRATGRTRELSIRTALGASRAGIIRLVLVEGGVLALAGGALGVLLGVFGVDLLRALVPADFRRMVAGLDRMRVNGAVLAFTALLSIASALLFALLPALRAARGAAGARDSLRSGATAGGRERHRLRRVLVGAEVALALVLLIGAGLTFRTFQHLATLPPGFETRGIALTSLALPGRTYPDGPAAARFFSRAVEHVAALPGVAAVGAANVVPLCGCNQTTSFNVVGQAPYSIDERPEVDWRVITPGYFDALRVPIRRGRDFTPADAAGAPPVVIVNETMARRWFPNGALGQRIFVQGDTTQPAEIVGIAGDMKHAGLARDPLPEMFLPAAQQPVWEMTLAVRTTGGDAAATALLPALRAAALQIDPNQPVYDQQTMRDLLAFSVLQYRFSLRLLAALALIAVLLAGVGIYGVISHLVAERTREIGIRIALGGDQATVQRLVVRQGMSPAAIGLLAGLILAPALTTLIRGRLVGVSPHDPLTFVAVAVLLLGVAVLACWLPARRAARVDPMIALRTEGGGGGGGGGWGDSVKAQALSPRSHNRETMDTLIQDIRYAVRQLRAHPGFTAAAVLTLALGIGANTAIFSVVDGVLLRPAPFDDIDRVMMIWETDRASGTTREPASIPDFADFKARSRTFRQMAALWALHASVTPNEGSPIRVPALAVSHEFLPMLGLHPLRGRVFLPEEDVAAGPPVVMINEAVWRDQFDRDPDIVGRAIRIGERQFTVVGVLPAGADFGVLQILRAAAYSRGFADRFGPTRVDLWFPLQEDPARAPRDNHPILVLGRLAADASPFLAQEEMSRIAADLEQTYPSANDQRGVNVEPVKDVVFGPVRPALLVLLGAVGLVLLVACANVTNLLLARGAVRLREITVRAALGASVARLSRQFLVESTVLTLVGAGLGVVLAWAGLQLLLGTAPSSIPRVDAVSLDARVLVVTFVLSLVVSAVAGLVPTLQARRLELAGALQSDPGRGGSASKEHRRVRSGLVVAELALAVMLMVGAGLLIRSLWRLQQVEPGFETAGVLKAEFLLPGSRYPQRMSDFPAWPEIRRFHAEAVRRLGALPGVTGVTIAGRHPLDRGFTSSIVVVGREAEARDWPEPAIRLVDEGYVPTMQVPVVAGRAFLPSDDQSGSPVVLVNKEARQRYFAGRDPIGQRIRLWGADRTVIGVLGGERFRGRAEAVPPAVYVPTGQSPVGSGSILVRSSSDPAALAAPVRRVIRDVDPEVPLFGIEPLAETLTNSEAERRFTTTVLGTFAGVALLLAIAGVHGVLTYTISRRTREIGIRMALGADRARVRSLVLGQGATLVALGLALGILGALALSQVLRTMLYGVGRSDPITLFGVTLILGGVALLASWLPARRAARVDPMIALRTD